MPEVVIYTSNLCGYCSMAKQLLRQKAVVFREICVDGAPQARQEMEKLSQRSTVPQVFIAGQAIGGYDDLAALDQRGELDKLLSST